MVQKRKANCTQQILFPICTLLYGRFVYMAASFQYDKFSNSPVYCQGIYHQSSLKTSAVYFADNLFVDWIDDILELEM